MSTLVHFGAVGENSEKKTHLNQGTHKDIILFYGSLFTSSNGMCTMLTRSLTTLNPSIGFSGTLCIIMRSLSFSDSNMTLTFFTLSV